VIGGTRPGSAADLATLLVALIGVSLPAFVIGTALLVVFGVWLRLVPIGQWGGLSAAILPALTLSLPFAAYIARLTRFGMIDEMTADYVRTARAKGVPELRVVLRHALKNAFLPVLSYLGPAAAMALTGSFVVEKIFAVPGIGTHFVNAVLSKDLTLIMGVVLVYSTILILFNLVVDVVYRWALHSRSVAVVSFDQPPWLAMDRRYFSGLRATFCRCFSTDLEILSEVLSLKPSNREMILPSTPTTKKVGTSSTLYSRAISVPLVITP
jgi:ABC-type microcin C transport system permease subunit YejB